MGDRTEKASNPLALLFENLSVCLVFILYLTIHVFVYGSQCAHAETDEVVENSNAESPSNYRIRSEEGVLVIYDATGNVVLRNDGHKKIISSPNDRPLFVSVQEGQTLSQIASQYPGITTKRLMTANEIEDANLIRMGDKIWIPTMEGVCHRVRAGETLTNIAENYRIADVTRVCEMNGIPLSDRHLIPGTLIVIPALFQGTTFEGKGPRISDFMDELADPKPSLADRILTAAAKREQENSNNQITEPSLAPNNVEGNRPRRSFFDPIPLDPADIAKRTLPSVVLLVMEDSHGQALGMGSGFLIGQGMVATNAHVVEKAARGYAKLTGQSDICDVRGYFSIDNKCDLCLLSVPELTAAPLQIGDPNEIAIGDEIYVVGNPQGLEGTFSTGIVSAIRHIDDETVLQITAPISPGSSGGPVLNKFGQVIGIATAIMTGGQNLNFAIPANYLERMQTQAREAIPFSSTAMNENNEIPVTEKLGTHSIEGVVASHFRWDSLYNAFSFSLRNTLRVPIQNVQYLVIFNDPEGLPVDCVGGSTRYEDVIPGGLANRIGGQTTNTVRDIVTQGGSPNSDSATKGLENIEIRILNFEIAEEGAPR